MALKLYSAYIKRNNDKKIEDIALVSENISILALLFNFLWFLSHKMWKISAIVIIIQIIIFKLYFVDFIYFLELVFVEIAFLATIAINANHLYGGFLKAKGYSLFGYVLAQNEEEARLKAMKILHHNSPNLSFEEFGENIIDPEFYLKSFKINTAKK